MKINGVRWVSAIQDLRVVRTVRRQASLTGRPQPSITKIYKQLGLPGPEDWQAGDFGHGPEWWDNIPEVLDADGSNLLDRYHIAFADDSTPQYPTGELGVIAAYVDDEGGLIAKDENYLDRLDVHIQIIPWPGLKICRARPYSAELQA